MEELASGQSVLSAPAQRIRAIEAAPLAENLGALLDEAARHAGEQVIWDFFEAGQKETY